MQPPIMSVYNNVRRSYKFNQNNMRHHFTFVCNRVDLFISWSPCRCAYTPVCAHVFVFLFLVSGVWEHGVQWEPSDWHHSWCNSLAWALMGPPRWLTGSADDIFWTVWKGENADCVNVFVCSLRFCVYVGTIFLRSNTAYLLVSCHSRDQMDALC